MKTTTGATVYESFPSKPPVKQLELKPCPFCGGKAAIRHTGVYQHPTYRAGCIYCGVTTGMVWVGRYNMLNGDKDVTITEEQAVHEAARLWNERVEAGA